MSERERKDDSRQPQEGQPVNRKHKDCLFRLAFQDRKDLLDLYNAVNGTNYGDPETLEITTLEDAVYLGVTNDVSFIAGSMMNLYEHQSSMNKNMPLRGVIYYSTLYQVYVKQNGYDLYGSRRITLPFPSYVVFYNGDTDEPEESEMLLSEAFKRPEKESQPSLECRVKILNINRGHNRELMERCRRLWEYAEFIGRIRENLKDGMKIKEAINEAMDTCEEQGILSDLLGRCRTEVADMLLAEYDEKKTMEYIRREEREIGREEGEEIGRRKGKKMGENLLATLLSRLFADNRLEDARLAASDERVRRRLYKEYRIPGGDSVEE